MIEINEIPGWCAGTKISGITDRSVKNLTIEELIKASVVEGRGTSVIVVSVNANEKEAIPWLKANGFKKAPWFKNHGHNGRKTCLFMYQVSKEDWLRFGGDNHF